MGRPWKTWRDCLKVDMESFGLSSAGIKEVKNRGNRLTQVYLEKLPLKQRVCVCVWAREVKIIGN